MDKPDIKNHKSREEISSGGIVLRGKELLIIKVENLQGELVWTFPKGHLEGQETREQAALREVEEETGWRCSLGEPFFDIQYDFIHDGILIHKTVHWFLMKPIKKVGESDPMEVMECRWAFQGEAEKLLSYPSDKEIMKRLQEKGLI